jgi:hypothetical protein
VFLDLEGFVAIGDATAASRDFFDVSGTMGSPKPGELLVPHRPTLGYHLEGKRDAACTLARGMQIGVSLDSEG